MNGPWDLVHGPFSPLRGIRSRIANHLQKERVRGNDGGGNHPVHPFREERLAIEYVLQQSSCFVEPALQRIHVRGGELGLINLRREFKCLLQRCNRFFVSARRRCFLKPSLRKLRSLQAKESVNFGNGIRMIIDSQVKHSTVPRLLRAETRHNEQCRRLSPANVAAVDFRRFECSDEACSEVAARALIRRQHRRPDCVIDHHVGLHAHAVAGEMPRRRDACCACVSSDAATGIQ